MNRTLSLVVLMLVIYSNAHTQTNPCNIQYTTDSAGHKRAEANLSVVGKDNDNLFCTAFRSGSDFGVYFGLEIFNRPICFKPGSKAIVIFTDKSQITLSNVQATNCKGNFLVVAPFSDNKPGDKLAFLNSLSTRLILAIRFYTTDGFFDYDVAEDDDSDGIHSAEDFRRSVECMKSATL